MEFEKQTAITLHKSRPHIVDKKFPIGGRPFYPFAVFGTRDPVKTNAMRRDEIEFSFEIVQGNPGLNTRDHAAHIKQFGSAAEEWLLVGIEAESFVAEEPA